MLSGHMHDHFCREHMSGKGKKSKGKGKGKDKATENAFTVDLTKQKGREVFIPGSFWGLSGEEGKKVWQCTVYQYDEGHKFADLPSNSVSSWQ